MSSAERKWCSWVNVDNELMREYHDREWGVPAYDDRTNRRKVSNGEGARVEAMARAAIQIDRALPEAHNALAMSLFLYDWDWRAQRKNFNALLQST
jgi:hypothetical protein